MISRRHTGFTLVELLVVVAIIAMLIGIMLPALGKARQTARIAKALSNHKQISAAGSSFSASRDGLLFTFTWKYGQNPPSDDVNFADLTGKSDRDAFGAARRELAYTIRRYTGTHRSKLAVLTHLIPHARWSHVPLVPYIGSKLPEELFIDPGDFVKQAWQRNHKRILDSPYAPLLPGQRKRDGEMYDPGLMQSLPYMASYRPTIGHWDYMQQVPARRGTAQKVRRRRVSPANFAWYYYVQTSIAPEDADDTDNISSRSSGARLGGNRYSNVQFPSQKVMMHDMYMRHFGPHALWFSYDESKIPLSFYDGSASVRMTVNANSGWFGTASRTGIYQVRPDPHIDGTRARDGNYDYVRVTYDSTQSGLRGIDFGGKPINIDTDYLN